MNRLVLALIGAGFVGTAFSVCSACAAPAVLSRIAARAGGLTLADLLSPEACPQWLALAREVSLGAVPRTGSERVFDGTRVRHLLDAVRDRVEELTNEENKAVLNDDREKHDKEKDDKYKDHDRRIPERIVVRNREAVKSCAEIAGFVASGAAAERLDCAAAGGVPEASSLELLKAGWNPRLARREYQLRCSKPEDCVPFLVWSVADNAVPGANGAGTRGTFVRPRLQNAVVSQPAPLIRRGQTAMLTWEGAGIRVVAPVTCLESGGLGQFVRVRFQNASQTLRAEVTGAGNLRATL